MDHTKGLVIIHTGEGKGKTTSALGLALRAWGNGLHILIIQFIKGGQHYGELDAISALQSVESETTGHIEIHQCGKGFTQRKTKNTNMDDHIKAAHNALNTAAYEMNSGNWDMIILDEICYAIKFNLIDLNDVVEIFNQKPSQLHLVLTGRDAPKELISKADLVTEMKLVRHPYQHGIKAQKGIEF